MSEAQKLSAEELAQLRQQLKREAKIQETIIPAGDTEGDAEGEKQDSKYVTVYISDDAMSASIVLSTPLGNELYSVPEVVHALRENGVVLGLNTQAIMDAINLGMYEEEIEAATGKAVVQGEEGYYEFLVDMEARKTSLIREDGTVDYSSVGKLTNIAKGDKIAVYHPATQGSAGYSVLGAEIPPKYAKDLPRLRGKYIEMNSEFEYFATIDGKISLRDYNVEILNIYEINDDIDLTKGVVEFYGDMIINGNVETGAVIRAGRNLTITGTVGNAKIFAGGDIMLTRGIQGAEKAKISCRGDLYADFIEYANIEVNGDIHANYIMNSNVKAKGRVSVEGSKGAIIGGYVHGLMGVELQNSGNISEPKTTIHAGFSIEDYNKFASLTQKEKEINSELAEAVAEMSDLLKIGRERGVNKAQKERIFELNEKKDASYAELDGISAEKKELGEQMAKAAGADIIAHGDLYRNTMICIDASILAIVDQEACVRFICRNDIIERKTVQRK